MECTEKMCLLARYDSSTSLQFVVPASREHLLDVTTHRTADVWRHHQVQLLLFSQRLQHLSYRNVIHHQRHFAALPPVRWVSASTVVRLSIASFVSPCRCHNHCGGWRVCSVPSVGAFFAFSCKIVQPFSSTSFCCTRRHFFCPSSYTDDALASPLIP